MIALFGEDKGARRDRLRRLLAELDLAHEREGVLEPFTKSARVEEKAKEESEEQDVCFNVNLTCPPIHTLPQLHSVILIYHQVFLILCSSPELSGIMRVPNRSFRRDISLLNSRCRVPNIGSKCRVLSTIYQSAFEKLRSSHCRSNCRFLFFEMFSCDSKVSCESGNFHMIRAIFMFSITLRKNSAARARGIESNRRLAAPALVRGLLGERVAAGHRVAVWRR